jgi:hypothetical protein
VIVASPRPDALHRCGNEPEGIYDGGAVARMVRGVWLPVLALGGYASQSYVASVAGEVERRGRPALLLYAGDFDPSGEDIDRDFLEHTDCFSEVGQVALTSEQVGASTFRPRRARCLTVAPPPLPHGMGASCSRAGSTRPDQPEPALRGCAGPVLGHVRV